MPKTRQLKHDFFLNEELARKSPHARLLFSGLWLLADREGRLEDRPQRIWMQLFAYEQVDVDALLNELIPNFIHRYEVGGKRYIVILKFTKHQHIHPDEKRSEIPPPPKKSPEIPGNLERSQEIMHNNTSSVSVTSSVPSPSPKQQPQKLAPAAFDQVLKGLKPKPNGRSKEDRLLNLRIPFGNRIGTHVVNLPADEAEFMLKNTPRLSKDLQAALRLRVKIKQEECRR